MNGRYDAVADVVDPDDIQAIPREVAFFPRHVNNFLQGPDDVTAFPQGDVHAEDRQGNAANTINFRVNTESCRFIAYSFFWLMCVFAHLITKFVTGPQLLQGPIEPGNTCPPFDGNKSHGFDVETNSHLKDAFGFNNVRIM